MSSGLLRCKEEEEQQDELTKEVEQEMLMSGFHTGGLQETLLDSLESVVHAVEGASSPNYGEIVESLSEDIFQSVFRESKAHPRFQEFMDAPGPGQAIYDTADADAKKQKSALRSFLMFLHLQPDRNHGEPGKSSEGKEEASAADKVENEKEQTPAACDGNGEGELKSKAEEDNEQKKNDMANLTFVHRKFSSILRSPP